MHALGWSREKAVEYMMTHSAASEENVKSEVCAMYICNERGGGPQ